MEILKIQNNLIKAAEARDLTGDERYFKDYKYYEDDNAVYMIDRAIAVYIIPKRLFYLDIDKVFNQAPTNIKKMIDDARYAEDLADTETEKTWGNRATVHIFATAAGDQIYLDKKLLKYHKLPECTFKGTKRNYPVYIYEEDLLTAVVLPVNYR